MVPNPPAAGSATLTYRLDPADGHILANTPMVARWRLIAADDPTDVQLGPEVRITYLDDRFTWKTQTGGIVTVHWVDGLGRVRQAGPSRSPRTPSREGVRRCSA